MDAADVSKLIQLQIAGRQSPPNSHGVDLHRCLVRPVRISVVNRSVLRGKIRDAVEDVWLVLEERPGAREGYQIVFSESGKAFGLVSEGLPSDTLPILCGWYGDFPTTLAAM